jgi:Ser/Thr protein kinase RdoA (MazF antagonist)
MTEERDQERLAGGNVAAFVLRVGDTVRKPVTAASPAIHAFLEHLRKSGVGEVPVSLGVDAEGFHAYEFIDGTVSEQMPPMSAHELHRLGSIIRRIHDAAATFSPTADAVWNVAIVPDREDIVCHHDLAPWNLVRNGERWVFIDWDGAGPGSRLWDLAYAVRAFLPLEAGGDQQADAGRLRAMAEGYGIEGGNGRTLADLLAPRAQAMVDLLCDGARRGIQPWARLHEEGHADYWQAAADYIRANEDIWRGALTL